MKHFITFTLLALLTLSGKAQYVTISDSTLLDWLNTNVPSAMNGNQMDTTNAAVTATKRIVIGDRLVRNLDGIQYFDSLITLDFSNKTWNLGFRNRVDSLPKLPAMLDTLICDLNILDSLPVLPNNLRYLSCYGNQLHYLPALPSGMEYLDCSANVLDSIPSLPSGLIRFNCGMNHVTFLPSLPANINSINCSRNLLTSLPALPISVLTVTCSFNQLQTLPALPSFMATLFCDNNQLNSLPALPSALTDLDCSFNQIPNLPTLPNSLINLGCSNNLLTTLPTLPVSLITLNCSSNQITGLPALPNSLTHLNCSSNQLPVLPALPGNLYKLLCDNNPLPALPTLPNSLVILSCSGDLLPSLPALPGSLVYLDCSHNFLTTLPALPSSLMELRCYNNQINVLPAQPNSLSLLYCQNNLLPVLPALSTSLFDLNCSYNYLSQLPGLPSGLGKLACYSNTITSLPSLPAGLFELFCQNNVIQNLPVLPDSLKRLDCSFNQIQCFTPFPKTPYFFNIYNNPFTCLPNYIPSMDSILLTVPLCQAGNANGCVSAYGITGFTYKDNSSNCIYDGGDRSLKNIPVKLLDANATLLGKTYTAVNGVYQFLDTANTYEVVVDTNGLPFTASCAYPGIDSTVTVARLDTNVNFALNCKPGFDIGVRSIAVCGIVFPGQNHQVFVNAGDLSKLYNLHCAAGVAGTLTVRFSGPVIYGGQGNGALTPNVSANTLRYTIADFGAVNNTSDFVFLLQPLTTAQAGDTISINIKVNPLAGDNNQINNDVTFKYLIVNSHDPNYKEVYPIDVPLNFNDWLTYTIHFQNTGNAPAINIRLLDTLDSELDLNTFEVISYSHNNMANLSGNILHVNFENIMLADSSSDPKASMGFFQYRIKPKTTWSYYHTIKNTAYIYFDFNEPIITNTTHNNKVDIITAINEPAPAGFGLSPNPNNGLFSISSINKEKTQMYIFDIAGNMVYADFMQGEKAIDVSFLPSGVYTISLNNTNITSNQKLIIVK